MFFQFLSFSLLKVFDLFSTSLPLSFRYMLLSALGFSLMAVCVKLAAQRGIPLLEIVAARALVSLFLSYADLKRKGLSPWGNKRGLLVARAVVGTLALMCAYYAVIVMPLADATVIQYLHPVFTAIIALIFLKERIHKATLLCIAFSFAGLVFVVRPEFLFGGMQSELPGIYYLIALGGAFGSAVAYVLVRKLNETDDSAVIIFYFPLFAFPFSIVLLGSDFVWPSGLDWLILLCVGIFTQMGQIGITKAMQTETAGRSTAYSYLQVVFAAILGWLFFYEVPSGWTVLGASLIVLGVLSNLLPTKSAKTS